MVGKGESQVSVRRIETNEKQTRAVELRKSGAKLQEIADRLDYASPSGAFKAIKTAMDNNPNVEVEDYRKLELARLDSLLMGIWNEAVVQKKLAYIAEARRLIIARARIAGVLEAGPLMAIQTNTNFTFQAGLPIEEAAALTDDPVKFKQRYYERLKQQYGDRIPDIVGDGKYPGGFKLQMQHLRMPDPKEEQWGERLSTLAWRRGRPSVWVWFRV